MKKIILSLVITFASALSVFAGAEVYSGKEMKQVVPPPCPEWYADREWNVSVWGTYVFAWNDWEDDTYLQSDHAWGGGIDAKYFFHRYFGIGLEGWAVQSRRQTFDFVIDPPVFIDEIDHDTRLVGAVLGTFTFRYPFHCSRFAPYIWGGAGVIFGGGERDEIVFDGFGGIGAVPTPLFHTEHHGSETEGIAQVGAGMEVRITRHVGWINDFSYNWIDGRDNNFGMVRSGFNFAF
jgi:hypothetical protein